MFNPFQSVNIRSGANSTDAPVFANELPIDLRGKVFICDVQADPTIPQ